MNRKALLITACAAAPALVVLALGATFGAAVVAFHALDAVTESKRALLEKDAEAIIKNIDERERDVHEAINEQAARYTELEMLMRAAPQREPERKPERPEDRRTWASYDPEPQDMPLAQLPEPDEEETPISTARLDAMLPPATPAMPY